MKPNIPEMFDRELFARTLADFICADTLDEAATATGISAPTLSRLERGGVPSLEIFFAICSLLKVSPASFMRGATVGGECLRCAAQKMRMERIKAIVEEGLL